MTGDTVVVVVVGDVVSMVHLLLPRGGGGCCDAGGSGWGYDTFKTKNIPCDNHGLVLYVKSSIGKRISLNASLPS